MSDKQNTELFERAAEMIDTWEGTSIAKVIEADIDRNDLEALRGHVAQAEAQATQEEYYAADTY